MSHGARCDPDGADGGGGRRVRGGPHGARAPGKLRGRIHGCRRRGVVRRTRRGRRSRFRALQRRVGTLLLSGDPAPGRRPARLRQRRRPRRVPRAGPHARPGPGPLGRPDTPGFADRSHGTPLPQRPRGRRGRRPVVALRRRHRGERPDRRRIRLRRRDRRHPQRRVDRSVRDQLRIGPALSQQRRRYVHRRVGRCRHRGAERLRRLGGVRRLRPGWMARSVRRQQRRLRPRRRHRVPQRGRRARLLPSGNLRRAAGPPVSQPRERRVRRRQRDGAPARLHRRGRTRDDGTIRTGAGRRHRRLRRRRLARHLRGQRRDREPPLDQPAGRNLHGCRVAVRCSPEPPRHA